MWCRILRCLPYPIEDSRRHIRRFLPWPDLHRDVPDTLAFIRRQQSEWADPGQRENRARQAIAGRRSGGRKADPEQPPPESGGNVLILPWKYRHRLKLPSPNKVFANFLAFSFVYVSEGILRVRGGSQASLPVPGELGQLPADGVTLSNRNVSPPADKTSAGFFCSLS